MYGKIFDSIYDSTLAEDWRALITFQQFIVLCDADGVVDMTPHAISRRTGIPIEHIEKGIGILESPDPYSRTPDQEGRRIERLDNHRPWGWSIVNHAHYKGLQDAETVREQNRIRQNRKRLKDKEVRHGENVTDRDSHAMSRHTDIDTDIDTTVLSNESTRQNVKPSDPIPFQKIVDCYHQVLPMLPRCIKLSTARKGQIRARWLDGIDNMDEWEAFFKRIAMSAFLTGRVPGRDEQAPFRADLQWVTKEGNFLKILEGKYDGKTKRA